MSAETWHSGAEGAAAAERARDTATEAAEPPVRYRRARAEDVPWVAALHVEGALSGVRREVACGGPRHRLYCDKVRALLEVEPDGLRVAECGGQVVGFVQATRDDAALKRAIRRPGRLLRYLAAGLTGRYGRDPEALREVWRRVRSFFGLGRVSVQADGATGVPGDGCAARIVSIVVAEEMRRRGIARRLMEEAFAYLRAAGATEVRLEVLTTNEAALAAYRRQGFERAGRYRDERGEWWIMRRSLCEAGAGEDSR